MAGMSTLLRAAVALPKAVTPTAAQQLSVHPHDGHATTPTGLPSWYGQHVGREQRNWLSKTGDVDLLAGNTFGNSYSSYRSAEIRAREASADGQGAVLIMSPSGHDVHAGRFYLARAYNAEYVKDKGLWVGRSQIDGTEKLGSWHPEAHALVSGDIVTGAAQLQRP